MTRPAALVLSFLVGSFPLVVTRSSAQDRQASAIRSAVGADCTAWQQCRDLALAARARGEYETLHDLAWRAVQTGPPNDPQLFYLLARAQSLSGRPYDALVTLSRLADELGVATDAASDDDFGRARAHPGWPSVEAAIERVGASTAVNTAPPSAPSAVVPPVTASPPLPAPPALVPPSPAATGVAAVIRPAAVSEALRFTTAPFTAGGLAHDTVSGRFLFGDQRGRKLLVVGEDSSYAVELVRSDSAGFLDVAAVAIDSRRGDLWVASSTSDGAGAVHRLQLVSGRPFNTVPVPADSTPAALTDLAIDRGGTVLVLDSLGRRLFALAPGARALEPVARFDEEPTSVSGGTREAVAYVATRLGLLRVDLRAGTTAAVGGPTGLDLGGLERIRAYDGNLVGIQTTPTGPRRIVLLRLDANGRTVRGITVLEESIPAQVGPPFVEVSGDELTYLVVAAAPGQSPNPGPSGTAEYVVRRVPLRD